MDDSGPIAQLVELPAHNRSVPGSSPGGPIWFDFASVGLNGLDGRFFARYMAGSL